MLYISLISVSKASGSVLLVANAGDRLRSDTGSLLRQKARSSTRASLKVVQMLI